MRIAVISDIHGREKWEDIYLKEQENTQLFIFLGDYFDTKEERVPPRQQADNLQRIRHYSHLNRNILLLMGNHDIQYIGGQHTNSFNRDAVSFARPILADMIQHKEIAVAAVIDNYLFSHAGISREWMDEHNCQTIEEINLKFYEDPVFVDFVYHCNASMRGENTYQSPLWIRPKSLMQNPYGNCHQIVGHTILDKIEYRENQKQKFYFCDARLNEYLIIENGKEIICSTRS